MKIRTLLPLATLAFAAAVQAAPPAPPAGGPGDLPPPGHHHRGGHDCHKPGGFLERFDRRAGLELSDAQKQKLKMLGEEERAKHEAIRQDYQKRFDAVLTKEQRGRLDAEREQARKQHAERLERRAEHLRERAQSLREAPPAPAAR